MGKLMIGRDLKVSYLAHRVARGASVLAGKDLRTAAWPVCTASPDLHAGEIMGLAGLVGSGRTELARALFGIERVYGGSTHRNGRPLTLKNPADAVRAGIFLVPEDRSCHPRSTCPSCPWR